MNSIPYTDQAAKIFVKKFCDQVFWLRHVRHMYQELFETDEARTLMERTAPSFFTQLEVILHGYVLLEFVKITDSAETWKNENFTVDNLVISIDWPQGTRMKLRLLCDKTMTFRSYILSSRNKLLAHTDKDIFLAGRTLGEFPEGEDEVFLNTLQEICDIAHEACFDSIFGHMVLAMPGDVVNLKRSLHNAVAFDKLLSESSLKEKSRLLAYKKISN